MRSARFFLFTLFIFYGVISFAQIALIPLPNEIKYTTGRFSYAKGFDVKTIRGDDGTRLVSKQLLDFFAVKKIPIVQFSPIAVSVNLLKENTVPNDGYTLSITNNNIAITSSSNAGLFYGLQSLFQLINQDTSTYKKGKLDTLYKTLPCVEIKDIPAFKFRGFEIDLCSRFFSVDVLKEYIDEMAKLKLNHLQLKLADQKVCRIPISNFPKSTLSDSVKIQNGEGYFSSYAKDEITSLVKYAREHFITIIPEIDFSFLLMNDTSVNQKASVDEILAIFPGKYLHIGNVNYFSKETIDYVVAKGIKIIGFDNALSTSIVQSYKNNNAGVNAAQKSKEVIMSPRNLTALDNYQYWDDSKLSKTMLYLPLDMVYKFDPLSKIKDEKIAEHILGGAATINTQFYKSKKELQKMVFPRLYAIAECLWTKKSNKKSFKDFNIRIEKIGYPGQPTQTISWVKFK
ncbi:MAG TPA: family 20 glycosylhydrolase [Chitinophagales bacterium]|nr:family 20 glycosylhydrolase [Chitinophagales bacterium]